MSVLTQVCEPLASLHTALALERHHQSAGLEVAVGRDPFSRYAAVLSTDVEQRLSKRIAALAAASPPLSAAERDEQTQLRALRTELGRLRVERALRALTARQVSCEDRLELDLEEAGTYPFRRADQLLAEARDRGHRADIERAFVAGLDELNPILLDRRSRLAEAANDQGFSSTLAMLRAHVGVAVAPLAEQMRELLAQTEAIYRETMGWLMRKKLNLELADAARFDLPALFGNSPLDAHFPGQLMVETVRGCLGEAGVDALAGGRIELDLAVRATSRVGARCEPVEVPNRIAIFCESTGGRRGWQRFYHELGQGLASAYTDPRLPYAYRRLRDGSVDVCYGFLVQYLLVNPGWLRRYVGLNARRDSVNYLFVANVEKLCHVRRAAARLLYELELYGPGVAISELPASYANHMRQALGLAYPRELYLYDADQSLACAHDLQAWLCEPLLVGSVVDSFDEDWYRNPACGAFLKRQWARGGRLTMDQLVEELGYERISVQPLVEAFERAL